MHAPRGIKGLLSPPLDKGLCWVCSRPIGPALTCPYCDHSRRDHSFQISLRIATLLGTLLGLWLLWSLARRQSVPLLSANSLATTANFSIIRMEGTVDHLSLQTDRRGYPPSLSFILHDESGEIRTFMNGPQVLHDAQSGRIPAKGDRIRILGTVTIGSGERPRIRLLKWEMIP